ncbi:sensor histidine kinase [Fluviicola chungangensis]|uniref:Signal transduction histidine kinase internal region domain-containing protein n=1 Tax=Fluviicola chungangensis TaxID=2597671 RepID=A0A556MRF0_9FLAO|nr:histidine kinase [Fluviicola chungangensis]TSJ42514.1 hypothetical protein FO442_12165 [Fluviicola chungangensis]
MKFICSIALVFLLVQSIKGQELYGKYLGHEQGLLSNECYDINYDENGYLIVGTPYGPMKFDGERFLPICTNLPLERRVMYDFEKDPEGNIYLLNSRNELFKLHQDKAIWIGPKNGSEFTSRKLSFIKLCFKNDHIYISTYLNVLKYSFKTQKISFPNKHDTVIQFTYQSKKQFPFTKFTGNSKQKKSSINVSFPETNQKFLQSSINFDSREDRITIGKTDYLLINMRLFKKTGKQVTLLNFDHILFLEYFHNRIWLCTLDGLIELEPDGNLVHHHFKGELIGGVAPLKSGGIAVSFNRKGVFISSNINNRIHYNFTATSAASILGMNLVGNSAGCVYQSTGYKLEKRITCVPVKSPLKRSFHEAIYAITSNKNNLVLNDGFGTSIFTPDFRKIADFRTPYLSAFGFFTYRENLYFIVRNDIIKSCWKDLKTIPINFSKSRIQIKEVQCYSRLNDSIMLLGTGKGLFEFNLKNDQFKQLKIFNKELRITGIHTLDKHTLLVCTRFDGVYVVFKDKIIRKIKAPCISISSSLVYKKQLIIRGNDGIYIRKLTSSHPIKWYHFFSGETENMFILDKKLLISYNKNLIIQNLSDYRFIYKPEIVLNKFKLGTRELNTLPRSIPSNHPISLDIDILQFDVNKLGIYYILKGEKTISQQIEGTKINFDALKSGEYELKVHPVIDGKVQFNNSKIFRFTIEETFWESTFFYIISVILIISILFSILLAINLRRKRRSAERSELESKLNEYKLLAVKAQVNPHFLSNGLAAIQALILKGNNDMAAHYLAKFSFLMRKILYYSDTQFISAQQELELADAYLELELLRFRNRFHIRKEINLSENQLIDIQFPSLLLQPILENAIWHGLKFQENNPELLILFHLNQNQELIVQISDNGPGFNSSNQSEEHLSKGNQLISERIDALNQQFQKQVASIEVFSSKSGTTVIFTFSPLLYQRKQHEGISN